MKRKLKVKLLHTDDSEPIIFGIYEIISLICGTEHKSVAQLGAMRDSKLTIVLRKRVLNVYSTFFTMDITLRRSQGTFAAFFFDVVTDQKGTIPSRPPGYIGDLAKIQQTARKKCFLRWLPKNTRGRYEISGNIGLSEDIFVEAMNKSGFKNVVAHMEKIIRPIIESIGRPNVRAVIELGRTIKEIR